MADKAEFLQAIDDAILDADSLEQFINGSDSETVLTRLSAEYPTLQKAIKELFENGGLPATPFATKALMTASDLVDGKYAMVTEDTDNNGLYVKTAGAWAKSVYDPLEQAKIDATNKANTAKSEAIAEAEIDATAKTDSAILAMRDEVALKVDFDASSSILRLLDKDGQSVGLVSEHGSLHISDVVTSGGSVEKRLSRLDKGVLIDAKKEQLLAIDKAIASNDKDPQILSTVLVTDSELPGSPAQVSGNTLIRLERNLFLSGYAYKQSTSDFVGGVRVMLYIRVNDDYTLDVSPAFEHTIKAGTDAFGTYTMGDRQYYYYTEGVYAGRLAMYTVRRYGTTRDVMCYAYTDDMGETWSELIDLSPFIPLEAEWRLTAASPAKIIQIKNGVHKGRLIIPCWHADTRYPDSIAGARSFIMYSDDFGDTYHIGAESTIATSNESTVAEFGEDGALMFVVRDASNRKSVAYSYDGGVTLEGLRRLDEVITTRVQSSLIQCANEFDLSTPKLVMTTPSRDGVRADLGIYMSYDNVTFEYFKQIQTGLVQYTEIEVIDESHFLVIGETDDRKSITAFVVNLKSILMG